MNGRDQRVGRNLDGWLDEEVALESRRPLVSPGKRTLTSQLPATRIMREAGSSESLASDAGDKVSRAAASGGTALPLSLRQSLEAKLGADLSRVRVHTGGASGDASAALRANAYTVGQDIHFADGTYDPESPAGQRLIAHEVAHTVQQQGASERTQTKLEVSSPGDVHETEADAFADAFVSGSDSPSLSPVASGSLSRQAIQREAPNKKAGSRPEMSWEKEIEFDIAGHKVKLTKDSLSATFKLDEIKYPKEDFELSKRFEPLTFCPGIYGYAVVGCSAGVTDTMKVTVTGSKTGEGDNTQWSIAVSGDNTVKGEAKGTLGVGLAAGAPGIANVSAEAAAIPTASLESTTGITGALTWTKAAGVGGSLSFPMKVSGSLNVELALRLMYEVFWKEHPTEFAKFTVGKWEIATATMEGTPKYTVGSGFSADVITPTIKWGSAPKPTHVAGRDPVAQKKLYAQRKKEWDDAVAGGSGAPGWHPDDDLEGEVLVDDGMGVTEIGPEQETADDGGMCLLEEEEPISSESGLDGGTSSMDDAGECTEEDPDGDGVPG